MAYATRRRCGRERRREKNVNSTHTTSTNRMCRMNVTQAQISQHERRWRWCAVNISQWVDNVRRLRAFNFDFGLKQIKKTTHTFFNSTTLDTSGRMKWRRNSQQFFFRIFKHICLGIDRCYWHRIKMWDKTSTRVKKKHTYPRKMCVSLWSLAIGVSCTMKY